MCNDGMGLLVITGWCFGIFLSLPLSLSIFHPVFCDHLHFADILPWRIATTGTQKKNP